jgi:hypothetical protein
MSTSDIVIVIAPLAILWIVMFVGFTVAHILDNRP